MAYLSHGVQLKSSNNNMIGALIGAGASLLGGLFGRHSAAKQQRQQAQLQYQYQTKLNEQQQQYARENALTDYERQRELTEDTAYLEKLGKRNAGINTAMTQDSSVGAASSVNGIAAPNAGSAPSVSSLGDLQYQSMQTSTGYGNFASSLVDLLSSIHLKKSEENKNNADTAGKQLENAFTIDQQEAELRAKYDKHLIDKTEYEKQLNELDVLRKTADARVKEEQERAKQSEQETEQSKIETRIKTQQEIYAQKQNEILDITKDMNKEQLKQLQFITDHQLEKYNADLREQYSRIAANKASAAASYSAAALNSAQTLYTNTLRQLEDAKVPNAAALAKALKDAAVADAEAKRGQAEIVKSQIPEARNKKNYHNSLGGKFFDTITEPLRVVFSSATSAATLVK